MTPESTKRLNQADQAHDKIVVSSGATVYFEWGLRSREGAWFRILRLTLHTNADIAEAKRELRADRDVVSLEVEKLT